MPICPLCGASQGDKAFSVVGYDVRACGGCGLFYVDPYPYDPANHYRLVRAYQFKEMTVLEPARYYEATRTVYDEYFPLVEPHLRGAASILDVGCGTGHLLERCAALGLRRAGIELNAERAAFARAKAGCEVFQTPIEDFHSPDPFDVITLMDVLSHLPSFDRLFVSVRSLLAPGGRLLIKTGELAPRVRRWDLYDWGIPDHLHFLGLQTISHICRKYGFELLEHRRVPLSAELFDPKRLLVRGRSRWRNALKAAIAYTPLAARLLRLHYDLRHGRRVYSSLMVLRARTP